MIKFDKQNRVNVRVRPGSTLEKMLHASSCSTATEAMHEIATRCDVLDRMTSNSAPRGVTSNG